MIKKLEVKNFKSIEKLELDFAKLNILIGEPNTGKSNILECLGVFSSLLYHNYAQDKNIISSDLVRYRSILNLFRDNNPKNKSSIKLDNIEITLKETELEGYGNQIDLKIYKDSVPEPEIHYLLETDGKYGGTEKGHSKFTEIVPKINFYRFKYLNEYPGTEYKHLFPPHGYNLLSVLQSHTKLTDLIYNILFPFGLRLNLRVEKKEIEIAKDVKGTFTSYPFNLAADTFFHLFMHLTAVKTCENSFLVFEEPETHLFPYYAKMLAEIITKDKTNQFLIATHNPYFLNSLIEKSKPADVNVYVATYRNHRTEISSLTKDDLSDVLSLDDIFFNLDIYTGELK